MDLKSVVPWGRSLNEYKDMFLLEDSDLNKTILGCGDGPACFNAQWTQMGGKVVSADPVYQFSSEQIRSRIEELYPEIMEQMSKTAKNYVWSNIKSVSDLGKIRMYAMNKFLLDFSSAPEGRYINSSLPDLPFESLQFDLALCSHYLFLYSDQVSENEHLAAITELCRVAKEIRVYPLIALDGTKSKHLEAVKGLLKDLNRTVLFKTTNYEFQKGATEMLVATAVYPCFCSGAQKARAR